MVSPALIIMMGFAASNWLHAETGFQAGSSFTAKRFEGYVEVTCYDLTPPTPIEKTVTHFCRKEQLLPSDHSKFVYEPAAGGSPVIADSVELNVLRMDGSTRSKSKDFDSRTQSSTDDFNLWAPTFIFSKPLLLGGSNRVDYILKQKRAVVTHGSFEVKVNDLGTFECPNDKVKSKDDSDCESSFNVCKTYIEKYTGADSSQCRRR